MECNFNSHENCVFFFHFGQFVRFENFVCFYTKNCNTTTQRTYLSWIWISWLLHVGRYNDAAIFNSSFFSQYRFRFQIQFIIFLKITFINFDLLLLFFSGQDGHARAGPATLFRFWLVENMLSCQLMSAWHSLVVIRLCWWSFTIQLSNT